MCAGGGDEEVCRSILVNRVGGEQDGRTLARCQPADQLPAWWQLPDAGLPRREARAANNAAKQGTGSDNEEQLQCNGVRYDLQF